MHRKIVGFVSLMLLVTATSVLAQGRQPQRIVIRQPEPMHKLEIAWYGGYSWTFSRHICGAFECGDIDLASTGYWTVEGDIVVTPEMQVAILYSRQDTDLTFRRTIGVTQKITDAALEYYHGGVIQGKRMGKAFPFGGFTLGATRYAFSPFVNDQGDRIGSIDEWKFSIMLQGGIKYYLSNRLGLRAQARFPFVFWGGGLGVGCGFGGCGGSFYGYGMAQIDVSAGIMLLL